MIILILVHKQLFTKKQINKKDNTQAKETVEQNENNKYDDTYSDLLRMSRRIITHPSFKGRISV